MKSVHCAASSERWSTRAPRVDESALGRHRRVLRNRPRMLGEAVVLPGLATDVARTQATNCR